MNLSPHSRFTPPLRRDHTAIAGIGLDLLQPERIERSLARFGDRFARKILGPEEYLKYQARSERSPIRGVRFLATRFAAKEAFAKAVGLGMRMPMTWRAVQVLNHRSGMPVLVISDSRLQAWYVERFGSAHVSITDEREMVAAYVIVEALPESPSAGAAPPGSQAPSN